jgi:hypothetical protein
LNRFTAAGALVALVALVCGPAAASPTDDVRGAMMRFADLSSWEISFDSGGRNGTMDFVKPGNLRMQSSGMEMVRVDRTTYMRMGPSAQWRKIPDTKSSRNPMDFSDRIRKMSQEANGISATDLGMKSVGGQPMHAYRMKDKDGQASTVYIARDGYVHRIDNGGTGGTINFSKFNQVAPIRPPI